MAVVHETCDVGPAHWYVDEPHIIMNFTIKERSDLVQMIKVWVIVWCEGDRLYYHGEFADWCIWFSIVHFFIYFDQ